MKKLLLMVVMAVMAMNVMAQRSMDKLDRGLIAIKTDAGVFCSWRILGEEYYDVTYNIYRDGTKLNAEPLSVSNFADAAGNAGSKYTVSAVVRGKEGAQCNAAGVWEQNYLEITPDHSGLKSTYVPNDACMADVDGDGELEILMKFDNQEERSNCHQVNGFHNEYSIFKVMKLDGTLLWWVECGPNMGDFQNNEQNIVAFDWDEDGKAEALMRLEEGSTIHMADGTTYTIGADGKNGTSWTNYREPAYVPTNGATIQMAFGLSDTATASCSANWVKTSISDGILYVTASSHSNEDSRSTTVTVTDGGGVKKYTFGQKGTKPGVEWFTHYGNEFLVYCNGTTGQPYQVKEFPLKRLESGETNLNAAWGDGYGHRSSKFFFGAPYLDGRHPSIFLARGIYTRHKMIALDVDPATHELTERWRWNCNDSSSPWYGNGYHNYAVADVDWDGRDEICFGSMVIDDNGKGLSTTGLGHGDAQHHGDFNPYIHGHEIYACNEDAPDNNYRDATTSMIYYRQTSSNDDGRAMMGNFSNDYPGCLGRSGHDTAISSVTNNHIPNDISFDVNFRIYWDGDLLEETFNGTGTRNSTGRIYKPSTGSTIATLTGSLTNNDTKATPCYQGDILGDWREEVIMRTADNKIRIYSTTIPTEWRNYTLWHDMQYRQAMVWQMCGYNQPPHVSYFLGELEGITQAPPALTMTDREEVHNGETIDQKFYNKNVILAETNDMTVNLGYAVINALIDNAPSWVQGHDDNDNITTQYYTHTLTGNEYLTGGMRLIKQGDGILKLDQMTYHNYTGQTDIWAGTVIFGGGLPYSHVWLNRFARLETYPDSWAQFGNGIDAFYGSVISPGGKGGKSTISVSKLNLGFGSILELDLYSKSDGPESIHDGIGCESLVIEKKDWQYGPKYSAPIIRITPHLAEGQTILPGGKYEIMQVNGKIEGSLDDIVIEGLEGQKCHLTCETNSDGFSRIYLVMESLRAPQSVAWVGTNDGIWDLANTKNFKVNGTSELSYFVTGDAVYFNNDQQPVIILNEDVAPSKVVFSTTGPFTLKGQGSIIGDASLECLGARLTIENVNKMTGDVTIAEGGTITVNSLANGEGIEYGALGGADNNITIKDYGVLKANDNIVSTHPINIEWSGNIEVASGKTMIQKGSITSEDGVTLAKQGAGTLQMSGAAKYSNLHLYNGTVAGGEINNIHQYPSYIVLYGGTLKDPDNLYSYSTNRANIEVPEYKSATWQLDSRCYYKGALTGKGALTVVVTSVRCQMQGDWSQFEGTLIFKNLKTGSYNPAIMWDNSYGLPNATVAGVFDNNGKSMSIGTITGATDDNPTGTTTLSGNGSYTTERIVARITKSRNGLRNSLIEVNSTLQLTGDVVVTFSGSSKMANGDTVHLWKCNSFKSSPDVNITLPDLPAGLYWDTSELLTNEGILKVTNTPTGIKGIKSDTQNSGKTYNLGGTQVEHPTQKGIYIHNGKKVVIK